MLKELGYTDEDATPTMFAKNFDEYRRLDDSVLGSVTADLKVGPTRGISEDM